MASVDQLPNPVDVQRVAIGARPLPPATADSIESDAAPPVVGQIAQSHHGKAAAILAVATAMMVAIVFLDLLTWIGN